MLTNHVRYQKYKQHTSSLIKHLSSKESWRAFFIPDDPKEHPRLVRFMLLTCFILVALTSLIFLVSFSFVRSGKPTVRVPGVEALNLLDAVSLIQSKNLIVHLEPRFNTHYLRHQIIKQHPVRGTMTREGRTVTLIVSLGIDEYIVPPLSGMTKEEAAKILEKNHIPHTFQTITMENQKTDTVIATSIPTGTKVSRDIPITVSVVDNNKKNMYKMENFLNQPLEFAANVLHNHEISPILKTSNVNTISEDGMILEQNTPEGVFLPRNSSVIFTIGLYPHDMGERERMKWQYFSYRFPRIEIPEVITMTNSITDEITHITPEAPTAKLYKVLLEDELGRSSILYEKMGAEGSSFIQVFKTYGQAYVFIYADDQIIGSKEYTVE